MSYGEGYEEAIRRAEASDKESMLEWLYELEGINNFTDYTDYSEEEIRQELIMQIGHQFYYED